MNGIDNSVVTAVLQYFTCLQVSEDVSVVQVCLSRHLMFISYHISYYPSSKPCYNIRVPVAVLMCHMSYVNCSI
jgi:hypothetical protein